MSIISFNPRSLGKQSARQFGLGPKARRLKQLRRAPSDRRSATFEASRWIRQCERRDLNPHVFRHQILSLARLPIPPLSRELFLIPAAAGRKLVRPRICTSRRTTPPGAGFNAGGPRLVLLPQFQAPRTVPAWPAGRTAWFARARWTARPKPIRLAPSRTVASQRSVYGVCSGHDGMFS